MKMAKDNPKVLLPDIRSVNEILFKIKGKIELKKIVGSKCQKTLIRGVPASSQNGSYQIE
jgi:hypothetical protein